MRKLFFFLFFIFTSFSAFGASFLLINDSVWQLTALIEAADGTDLDQVTLTPGEQFRWSTELYNSKVKENQVPSSSLTPFTITWLCPQKGTYSVCSNVGPGATVTASSGAGTYRCTTKKEMEEQKENLQCPPCPACPPCPVPKETKEPNQENEVKTEAKETSKK